MFRRIRREVRTRLIFLEAEDATLVRRFSETRRPHPLGTDLSVAQSIEFERVQLAPIRALADNIVNTSKLNVHELRDLIADAFHGDRDEAKIRIDITSLGYHYRVPPDSELAFAAPVVAKPSHLAAI